MTVFCAKCGTELLGAVNRCWKCGLPVVSSADNSPLPPVRRAPVLGPLHVPPWEAISAEVLEPESAPNATGVAEPATGTGAKRRGSPFPPGERGELISNEAARSTASVGGRLRGLRQWSQARARAASGSTAGLVAAVAGALMGGGAFSLRDYPELALALAVAGLVLAAAGFVFGARIPAGVATLLCVLALLWSTYQMAITLYERRFGRTPWEEESEEWEETPTEPLGPR